VPTAYSSIVYGKGALVLYMLDRLLAEETGSDQALLDVLRDFLKSSQGKVVSTSDFAAAVARRAPGDWSWFFDQWVERAQVPTYRWSSTMSGNSVTLKVTQDDVPAGFRMPVPVRVELDGAGPVEKTVLVDGPQKSFELSFDAKPKSVVFNPDYAVLAKVKKD
jgi:aminopeptidase N